ncbi:PadR family transcriptional regulator [Paenibacillus sp. LMG 31456]|uniref:PadR family transcriptional regulator n=1 Tax=Paenibacillus foliorum TaxID=2654974 RepID=A0A972K0F9_9BACL|nr:PadR family transcriptional regulator [Paenibacillus foliorum]NOU94626.1 PadR family transcriptional regulator [Paenibacillus foliorum]
MNTLSYGLLAMLTGGPRTGYELMQQIQPLWRAKHSQIYPLLAKLEQSGSVRFVPVAQKEKPDKKIYSITEQGLAELREWIPRTTSEPVKRDELLLKAYCVALTDPFTAKSLIQNRITLYQSKLEKYSQMLAELKNKLDGELSLTSPGFGNYILLQRAVSNSQAELEWCGWVSGLLPPSPSNQ